MPQQAPASPSKPQLAPPIQMLPSYMVSNAEWCNHKMHYWYVVMSLSPFEDVIEDENPTETYYEIYSDY
jgi:hypothetical protein